MRTRSRKKQAKRLDVRRKQHSPPKNAATGAYTAPGSQNAHKPCSLREPNMGPRERSRRATA